METEKKSNLSWEELEKECNACKKCPLGQTRTNLVFGTGNKNAELMFVGEAPGENEDLSGIPFVGRAGKLFDKYLEAVGIERDSVYICNILKCRPPKNRDPKPEEEDLCIGYLRDQVRLVKPKMIVCLGRISAQKLIDKNFKVTKQHGEFIEKGGILFMGTFHPAALLRNPNNKPQALEDFLALRRKILEVCDHTY